MLRANLGWKGMVRHSHECMLLIMYIGVHEVVCVCKICICVSMHVSEHIYVCVCICICIYTYMRTM